MRAHSEDLRARILAAVLDEKQSQAQAARRFAVGQATVSVLMERARELGRDLAVVALPREGRRPRLDEAGRMALAAHVRQERPDATLAEVQRFVSKRLGKSLGVARLCQLLAELDLPRKKRPSSPWSATSKNVRSGSRSARPRWPRAA